MVINRAGRTRPANTKGGIDLISKEEFSSLQPGDKIVVIPEEYAVEHGYWDGRRAGWITVMNTYCGRELTVACISDSKVFVKENNYWWVRDFIDYVIFREEYECATSDELLSLLTVRGE